MSFLSEFKDFAMKGNVVDMAVGIIIGAAFGKVVASFVNDILMPPIGMVLGGVNFSELALVIQEAENGVEHIAINYGAFIQTLIEFLIIAAAIFVAIKVMNKLQGHKTDEPEQPISNQEKLLVEIRDLLKNILM